MGALFWFWVLRVFVSVIFLGGKVDVLEGRYPVSALFGVVVQPMDGQSVFSHELFIATRGRDRRCTVAMCCS